MRKKSSNHEILSQRDKQANAEKGIVLDSTSSHMSYQEELECLRPTVENINNFYFLYQYLN